MQFPKRPDQHTIEDKSFRIWSSALPDDWLIREATKKDYGIDAYVEPCEGGLLTGKMFLAQLKGSKNILTHKDKGDEYVSCSGINSATLNYWYNIPTPVMIFYIDTVSDEIYYQNVKSFIRQNFGEFKKEALHTIRIPIEKKFESLNYKADEGRIINGLRLFVEYIHEIRRERFEFLTNDFIANFESRLNLLAAHDHADSFLPIEQGESDYVALINTHNILISLCDYLGIKHEILTLKEMLKQGRERFGGKYFSGELYEEQVAHFAKIAFPVIKEISKALSNLILKKESDYWDYKSLIFKNMMFNHFFDNLLAPFDWMFKQFPTSKP